MTNLVGLKREITILSKALIKSPTLAGDSINCSQHQKQAILTAYNILKTKPLTERSTEENRRIYYAEAIIHSLPRQKISIH